MTEYKAMEHALQSDKAFIERYLPQFQYYNWYKEMDAMQGNYRLILIPPGVGKSTKWQIRALRMICRARYEAKGEPFDVRIGFFSKSKDKASNFMSVVANLMETNKKLIEDFGEFHDKKLEWNTEKIRVKDSRQDVATPTITNLGVSGQVESLRFHLIIADDPVDLETSLSPTETDKMDKRLGIWLERLEPDAQLAIIGHRFTPNDFYTLVEERPGFERLILPAYDPETRTTICPERWPYDKFKTEKLDMLKAYEIECHYQQKKVSMEDCAFRWEWFEGPDRYQFIDEIPEGPGKRAYFDPAYSDATKRGADYSAAIAACKFADGVLITGMQRWKMSSGWSSRFCDFAKRHEASKLYPEVNNAQTLGTEMKEYIRRNRMSMMVLEFKSKGKKEFRIGELEPPAKHGRIWFSEALMGTDGFKEFKTQWLMFPNYKYDDLLDALYYAVSDLVKTKRERFAYLR